VCPSYAHCLEAGVRRTAAQLWARVVRVHVPRRPGCHRRTPSRRSDDDEQRLNEEERAKKQGKRPIPSATKAASR